MRGCCTGVPDEKLRCDNSCNRGLYVKLKTYSCFQCLQCLCCLQHPIYSKVTLSGVSCSKPGLLFLVEQRRNTRKRSLSFFVHFVQRFGFFFSFSLMLSIVTQLERSRCCFEALQVRRQHTADYLKRPEASPHTQYATQFDQTVFGFPSHVLSI